MLLIRILKAQILNEFIQWKRASGFKVIDAYTDDPAVGNTTTTIKAYLQAKYDTVQQSYVLLVGDVVDDDDNVLIPAL